MFLLDLPELQQRLLHADPLTENIAQVFLSYNWGMQTVEKDGTKRYSTQGIVSELQRRIEVEADITCWLDIAGGMGAGQDHLKEMVDGVQCASVFVAFLSDAYVISKNCRFVCGHERMSVLSVFQVKTSVEGA